MFAFNKARSEQVADVSQIHVLTALMERVGRPGSIQKWSWGGGALSEIGSLLGGNVRGPQ